MKRTISMIAAALVLMTSVISCSQRVPAASSGAPQAAPTLQPVQKVLSPFTPIKGTDYLMASITAEPASRESSLNPLDWINSSGYYSPYSYNVFNYVFFNTKTETVHKLLPKNDHVILQVSGYPTLIYDPANPNQAAPVIEWWVYNVIKADTNANGILDYGDKLTICMSDVGGNGYTELIDHVDAILGVEYLDNSSMFIIYTADHKSFIAKVRPSTFEVLSTTELDLGEDVQ